MLEAVVNVSEGRDRRRIGAIGAAAGRRCSTCTPIPTTTARVFTIAAREAGDDRGRGAPARRRSRSRTSISRDHDGVHPRLGVVDVVPFVALAPTPTDVAVAAAHAFARVARPRRSTVPVFLYDDADARRAARCPTVRRDAFTGARARRRARGARPDARRDRGRRRGRRSSR